MAKQTKLADPPPTPAKPPALDPYQTLLFQIIELCAGHDTYHINRVLDTVKTFYPTKLTVKPIETLERIFHPIGWIRSRFSWQPSNAGTYGAWRVLPDDIVERHRTLYARVYYQE